MFEDKIVTINGTEYKLIKWSMTRVLKYHNKIIPILKDPIVNMTAISHLGPREGEELQEDNASTMMAACADGLMVAMANVDMEEIFLIVSEGCGFKNKTGIMVPVTLAALEADGKDISDIWQFTIEVIKHNYGALLKNALTGSLNSLLS